MRITLDTNVLVYALNADDRNHAAAVAIVERAAAADCVQTLQSLGECFRVLIRRYRYPSRAAAEELERFRLLFPTVAAAESDLDHAVGLVSQHQLSFWDAMMLATAHRHGCRVFLSEDMHDGRNLQGLRILNPFNEANRELIDLVLPPVEH